MSAPHSGRVKGGLGLPLSVVKGLLPVPLVISLLLTIAFVVRSLTELNPSTAPRRAKAAAAGS